MPAGPKGTPLVQVGSDVPAASGQAENLVFPLK